MAEMIAGTRAPSAQSQGSAVPGPDAWRALGRDTPAGKALFALYNGDAKGKSVGNTYHAHNKLKHDIRVAEGWTPRPKEPPPPHIERPQVNYPKFGRDKHPKEAPVHSLPRRKPASQIMAELEQDKQTIRQYRPTPSRRLLDDKEKERCAALMRYRGQIPAITPEEMATAAIQRGARDPVSEREELQRLFDGIMREIEERKDFMRDMEAAGKLSRDMRHQLHSEIKQRVNELERMDLIINEREDSARAAAGLPPR